MNPFPLPRLLHLRDQVSDAARTLGAWARTYAERARAGAGDLMVNEKSGPGDVVTFADAEVQRRLVVDLTQWAPEAGMLGEEGLDARTPNAPTWVIDPIDGTQNYVHDYPGFCVSIALVVGGRSVLGVVYDAGQDRVYSAIDGAGAWRDGVRIARRGVVTMQQALIATNFTAPSIASTQHLAFFTTLARRAAGIRSSGAACRDWCLLADGRTDLFWQFGLQPWDLAAGMVLVREAGGRFVIHPHHDDWLAGPSDAFAGEAALVEEAVALARAGR